jgi:hypothetical protein
MIERIMKKLFLMTIFFLCFEVESKTSNALKLSCEYNQNLIKKEQKGIGFLEYEKLDIFQICKFFGCKDTVEIHKHDNVSNNEIEYRLKNSWFNHQGILLDEFLVTEKSITIITFVSQAYFLESYIVDRASGRTKRTFYRFNDPDFFYNIKKLEKEQQSNGSLFNEKGKLSLKTLNSFSLKPNEVFYFEGKCQEGTGV